MSQSFKLGNVSHEDPYGIANYTIDSIDKGSQVIEASCYANSVIHLEFNEGEITVASLIDTGAACNCIRLDTLKKIKPDFKLDKNNGIVFSAANKQSITPLGSTYVEFTVNGHPSCAKVHVFENLNQRFILGRPWIISNQVQIDLAHETIRMKSVPLFAAADCTLKPFEVSLVQARFSLKDSYLFPDGLHGLVTPRHDSKFGPQVLDIAATCCDGNVPVLMRNNTGEPVLIRKARAISDYSPLSIEDLSEHAIREDQTFHNIQDIDTLQQLSLNEIKTNDHENISSNDIKTNGHKPLSSNDIKTDEHQTLSFDLSKSDCTSEQTSCLRNMLHKHEKAFSVDGKINCSKLEPLVIDIKPGSQPLCRQPYRLPPDVRESVNEQIKMLLAQDIIEPAKNLQFCSPLLAIKKNVKKSRKHLQQSSLTKPNIRVVADVRHLNSCIIFPHYEIMSLTTILDILGDAKPCYFSVLDLKNGYWQVKLSKLSRPLTGFLWQNGAYQWTRMIQGISSAPMAFTQRLSTVFRPYLGTFMVLYLDDLCIYSSNFEDHLKHLSLVLSKLEEYDLKLSPDKCTFATKSAKFLGHEISHLGVQPSNDHVSAIRSMPSPLNASSLKSCIGLFTFFHTFIPNRGKLMSPLLHLLRKGVSWNWTSECEHSFEKLKAIMSSKPLLRHADFSKHFHIMTDASVTAIAGVILQVCERTGKFVPIAFASRATTVAERKRPIMEIEALAVVFCITTFSHYVTGRQFTLYTDNVAVKDLLSNKRKLSPKLTRWALFLSEYSFNIEYVKTSDNKVSDCLSRCPYDYTRTEADDKMDDFPHIPGIDLLSTPYGIYLPPECDTLSESDSDEDELIDSSQQSLKSRMLKPKMWYEPGEIDTIDAITRAQAARTTALALEAEKEAEIIARELPYNNVSTHNALPDIEQAPSAWSRPVHWRNKQLRRAKRPKRLLLSRTELSEAIIDSSKSELLDLSPASMRKAQLQDTFCGDLIRYLEDDILPYTVRRQRKCILREMDYTMGNGCLWHIWSPHGVVKDIQIRLVMPKSLRNKVIQLVHTSNIGTHAGVSKTINLLRTRYVWKGLNMDVRHFIGNCDACYLAKHGQQLEQVERTLFDLTCRPFQRVAVDYCGPLDMSLNGNLHFGLCIDHYSGFIICWPSRNVTAKSFAKDFYEKVVCIHGCPAEVLSDRGSAFVSHLWTHLADLLDVRRTFTAGYHPATNGRAEKMNGHVVNLLRTLVSEKPREWDKYLPSVVFSINNTVCNSHGVTPFICLHGYAPTTILDHGKLAALENEPMTDILETVFEGQKVAQDMAIRLFEKRSKRLKEIHDSKVKKSHLTAGDVVFYYRPAVKDPSRPKKLQITKWGPALVTEVFSNGCASIRHLHKNEKIKHRVNISQLLRAPLYDKPSTQSDTMGENTPAPLFEAPKLPRKAKQADGN